MCRVQGILYKQFRFSLFACHDDDDNKYEILPNKNERKNEI